MKNRSTWMNELGVKIAFAAGLGVLAWVGAGYVGTSLLALMVTLLITAFYLMGALELRRFHHDTQALQAALAALPRPLPVLADWLATLPAALRPSVRLRIEGERGGLPGPAMAPYLVGLLVVLGMLGTFLGMVVTLKGAVLALQGSTDIPTIRAALSAPVQGLGLAFGTSVGGVAASAMLGLISAWCRRERLQAAQALDASIAAELRVHSLAHQRDASLQALQAQQRLLPELVQGLQGLMGQMQQQQAALHDRLLASQADFHAHTEQAYGALARSVDRSLQDSLAAGARAAGAAIEPVVQATMASLAQESRQVQAGLGQVVRQQLDGLAERFDHTVGTVASHWTRALARHEESSAQLAQGLDGALQRFNHGFDARAGALLDGLASGQAALLAGWQGQTEAQASHWQQQAAALAAHQQQQAAAQASHLQQQAAAQSAQQHQLATALAAHQQAQAEAWQARSAALAEQQGQQAAEWQARTQALAEQQQRQQAEWLAALGQAQARQQQAQQAERQAHQAQLAASLAQLASTLQQAWQQAGEQSLAQQQQICQTLADTAQRIHTQAEAQARQTVAEVSRLMQLSAEAPRAAAELTGLLRDKLSDSLARDNELLAERSRTLATLDTLLGAVNHAAHEQRAGIDALVASADALMQQVGSRFAEQVQAESARLGQAAAQITGSAAEVASLGEAFGAAVQAFGASNQALMAQLQQIEAALARSSSRSDEQMAYYVAQAREIVDLTLSSQQQIVDDLQQLARRPAAARSSEVA